MLFSKCSPVFGASVAVVGLISLSAGAQTFIGGGDAPTYNTQPAVTILDHSGDAGSREAVHTIDGSGMVTKTTDDGTYTNMALFRFHTHDNPGTIVGSNWVKYGFDQAYPLQDVWIWNWNEMAPTTGDNTRFGWQFAAIQTSLDGITWSAPIHVTIPQSDASIPSPVDLIVPINTMAQYVVLTNTGVGATLTYGGDDGVNDAGLSEVRFAVPEPTALGFLSFAGVALLRRRK